jgi:arginyl-tRNA synthetase
MDFPFRTILKQRLTNALSSIGLSSPDEGSPDLSPAADTRFGDYQSNVAMVLAKERKANPRALATEITAALDVADLCHPPTIAGPGFINFRIKPEALGQKVTQILSDKRLGVPALSVPQRVVIDFSAPNIAKPMHVGHIRSTIIGESLARVARFLGHEVITDNHIGDWGKQFGMILYGWKHHLDPSALETDPIAELVRVYKFVNQEVKENPAVDDACRHELALLQAGDEENLAIWQKCVDVSRKGLDEIYARLDVHFDHWLGESFYNDKMGPMADAMLESGLATVSDGAACVFFPDIPDMADKPCMIRKSDGTFGYAASDLATIAFRVKEWKADQIWYVVGAPQQLHFRQIFDTARRLGYSTRLVHIAFGSILGEDRQMMKTRSGETIHLGYVLQEAVERARKVVDEKNPLLPEDVRASIAETIGIGAVKYAELSQHRLTDYVFSWDKMLSLQGNTAPYLLNSYVRICSIFRKLEQDGAPEGPVSPVTQEEITLALQLCQFGEIVPEVLSDFRPNLLASYLYDLAKAYHSFYEACPVLRAEPEIRDSRLRLIEACRRVLGTGLGLLGIQTVDQM